MQSITKNFDLRRFILDFVRKNGSIRLKDITAKTGLSQPYIHRIISKLIENGSLIKAGKGRNTFYSSPSSRVFENVNSITVRLTNKGLNESDVLEGVQRQTGIFRKIPKNVKHIAEYAFTEMLNNAIEHSASKQIMIKSEKLNDVIRFDITDRGIGIFVNLIKKFRLSDAFEAIQELLKGKRTTMPDAHSGEGIFFTSKATDTFIIQSSGKRLFVNNTIDDIILGKSRINEGTKITFTVSLNTRKKLKDVFDEYTDDEYRFSKTRIQVKLFKYGSEFLSRSQARRILTGLETFITIVLDFKNVESIGQAFADEIFRIYKKKNNEKKIEYINVNENILFMIKRALSNNR